jgi:ATP-binding cassette, subfamily B, bacterial
VAPRHDRVVDLSGRPTVTPVTASRAKNVHEQALEDLSRQPDAGLLKQFWRFRSYGRGEVRSLTVGMVMRALEFAADLATPWPLALVVDGVLRGSRPGGMLGSAAALFGPTQLGMLGVAAVAVLLITSLSGAFDYLGDRVMNSSGERITMSIRRDVFAHMQRLPMGYHDRQAVGELTSRIATDTGRIEDGMVGLFATLLPGVLSLAGYTVVLLSVNWRLGMIALCAAPLLFFTASRYTRLTRKSARRRRAAEGRLSGFVAESLQGIRTVQAFGRQELHDQRFADGNDKVLSAGLRAVELRARFTPLLEVIAAIGTATLLFVGGYGVLHQWWSVGVLIVVTSYLRDLLKPMKDLSKLALTFTQGAASAERIAAIFDQQRPDPEVTGTLPELVSGSIQLQDVGLDYGRGPVLQHINLDIPAGERIALLGHNGAGKSTLLSLISGLYPPTTGQIVLDGISLVDAPDWWRRQQVSVVLQDTFLFSGTIAENIRYGRPDATDDEVLHAAKAALVTEFTDPLEDGVHTELADGGIGLSGGQRQRVGIARALLTNAPIVLLDEPTTGLDVHAEQLVVQALTTLVTSRTVIMTTHRPALTQLATRVIHLAHGQVAENPDEAALAADPRAEIGAASAGIDAPADAGTGSAVADTEPVTQIIPASPAGTWGGGPVGRAPRPGGGGPRPVGGPRPRSVGRPGPGVPRRSPEAVGPRRAAEPDWYRSDPGRHPNEHLRHPDVSPDRQQAVTNGQVPPPPVQQSSAPRPPAQAPAPRSQPPSPPPGDNGANRRRIGRFTGGPEPTHRAGQPADETWWDSYTREPAESDQRREQSVNGHPHARVDQRPRTMGDESCA